MAIKGVDAAVSKMEPPEPPPPDALTANPLPPAPPVLARLRGDESFHRALPSVYNRPVQSADTPQIPKSRLSWVEAIIVVAIQSIVPALLDWGLHFAPDSIQLAPLCCVALLPYLVAPPTKGVPSPQQTRLPHFHLPVRVRSCLTRYPFR